ncbi:MAG: response regulator, partial [Gemmatimonadales bacterium]
FLATMSHELRTPLNSVIGFSNLLRRNRAGNLGDQDIQFLDRIRDNGVHLLGLINDVLDVSKIEAGRMEVHPVPTDLAPLVRDTIAQLGGQAATHSVELQAIAPDGLLPVEVDPVRLKQVLINLIGNALKFTEHGSVTVKVVAEAGGRPLRIDVIDTGVGIAPDRLEAIFEAFTQADASTERRFGGTGLGLTISRSLLRLMGADLSVASASGKGSIFSITFPASAARAAADLVHRELTPVALPPPGPAPLILVIDDEADARTLLRSYLEDDGYRTAEATGGAEGLDHARTLRPALITLDLRMPGISGVEFLRQLRADPRIAGIPVLVVSIEAAEHRGALLGVVDVLAKPVERDGLLGVVQRILPTDRRKVLVVDDDVHTRQLFAALLGAEGYQVRTARDGLEALDAMAKDRPDLVLLDLMMPVMEGGTFLATLRADLRYASLPVAVVTALDVDSEAVRRLKGIVQAVVQKGPALEQTLRGVLHNVLGDGVRSPRGP